MAVVVVAAVGVDGLWTSSGPPASSPYRWDGVDQRDELGDVVAVAAGEADGQRDARALGDHVVFRAGPGAVDRARTGFGPPLSARTWVNRPGDLGDSDHCAPAGATGTLC